MGYDGSLKFDTEIIEKGFNAGVKKLGSIAKSGAKEVALAVGASTAAMSAGVAMGVKYNAEMENFFTDFKVMLGSAEEATEFVEKLKEMAAKTPFEMTDLANASKILLAFGSDAQAVQEQIKMLGDISLGNAEKMKTLATAFGRIQSNGRASLEEINMMIDIGFNPLNLIAQKTGESMDELRSRVSEGGVSFEEIAEAMRTATSEGGQFFNGMEEGSKTLTGQFSTLKDNVNNLLGEMTKGVSDNLRDNLIPAAIDAVDQMTKAFESDGFSGLIEVGAKAVGNIAKGIISRKAEILSAAAGIAKDLINKFIEYAPTLLQEAGNFISNIGQAFMESAPSLIEEGYNILKNIVDGFVEGIPTYLPMVLDFIQSIGEKIAEFAPVLIQKGFELIGKLAEGIVTAIPILIEKVPTIISTFANIINDNFPTILAKGAEIIGQLVLGIIQAIPTIIANIPQIIAAIVDTIMAFQWLTLGKNIIDFFVNGIKSMIANVKAAGTSVLNGIKDTLLKLPSKLAEIGRNAIKDLGGTISKGVTTIKTAAFKILNAIVDTIKTIPGKMLDIGKNIVKGLWDGISNMTGWIIDKVGGFASGVVGGIKDFLGIHSPSTVMRDKIGKYMAEGVGVGFVKNIPVKQMTSGLKNAITQMQAKASAITATIPTTANVATKAVTNNYTDMQLDYDKIEKAQLRAMNEANKQPIMLNNRNVRRSLIEEGFVTV